MNGIDINALNLYNDGVKIWSKSGQQGNMWKKAEVTITGKYDVSDSDVFFFFIKVLKVQFQLHKIHRKMVNSLVLFGLFS